jgi:hypothetical protein
LRRRAWWILVVPLVTLVTGPPVAAQECDVRGAVETPAEQAIVTDRPVVISGWAADVAATTGTGISEVRVALDADPQMGGVPVPALYGWERPDIADLLGTPRLQPSGFALLWDAASVPPVRNTLYIQARSACGWILVTRTVSVIGQRVSPLGSPTALTSTGPESLVGSIPAPGTTATHRSP